MPNTPKLTATGHMIGQCVVCRQRYYAASVEESRGMSCGCRAGIVCEIVNHGHGRPGGIATPDHPVTFIKWATVRARKSDKACDSSCQSARGRDCACECAGENHGRGWAACARS